jgi:uncharacterized protein YbgA (DUF1722 family)/uncharacterized protein YbbK (DUF523 family)
MKMAAAPRETPRTEPIRIGVSSCLLGNAVRYDGGHKRDAFLTDTFGGYVEWVPVCPELELGLGVPRPSMRLERRGDEVRLIVPRTGADHTVAMRRYAATRVAALAEVALCGYILKKDSPSCGMERVKVHEGTAVPTRRGRGMFAEILVQRYPHLPVEEEGRLCDPRLRENFVERVFAYHRLQLLFAPRWTPAHLVAFHTQHKLQLLAHSPAAYARLGRLVATSKAMPRATLRARYAAEFMDALKVLATRGRHANVLQHIAGYFTAQLDSESRRELQAQIEDYRTGVVPLVVPITLVRHYVRRFAIAYLAQQVYLDPHPKELMLRNHV